VKQPFQSLIVLSSLLCGAAAAQETISLAVWDTGEGAKRIEQIVNGFMQENPGVRVKIEQQTGADDPSILVRMASGTAPDVIQTGEYNLKRRALASEGGYLDLTPYINADRSFNPRSFYPSVYNVGVVNKKTYVLNKDFASVAFYVNTEMFQKAGIKVPKDGWSYDDLVRIGQQLTLDANGNNATSPNFDPKKITQYGWWHDVGWVRGWQSVPYAFGAKFLSSDGQRATGFLNSSAMRRAVEFYRDSVHKYGISPSVAAINAQPGADLFASRQAAIRGPTGPWFLESYSGNPGLKYTTVPMPKGTNGQASVVCWSGFGVNRKTKSPKAAYDFVKYVATKGQKILVNFGMSADIATSKQTGRDEDALWGTFMKEVPNMRPLDDLKTAHWVECVNTPMGKLLEAVQGPDGTRVNVKAELDAMAKKADPCLKQKF
jgi:multiple sugar transport system substrate-binding protein